MLKRFWDWLTNKPPNWMMQLASCRTVDEARELFNDQKFMEAVMIDENEKGMEHIKVSYYAVRRGLRDLCGKNVLSYKDFRGIVEALHRLEDATDMGISTTCFKCGWTSYHPEDVKQKYCGNCHKFYNEMGFEQVER